MWFKGDLKKKKDTYRSGILKWICKWKHLFHSVRGSQSNLPWSELMCEKTSIILHCYQSCQIAPREWESESVEGCTINYAQFSTEAQNFPIVTIVQIRTIKRILNQAWWPTSRLNQPYRRLVQDWYNRSSLQVIKTWQW